MITFKYVLALFLATTLLSAADYCSLAVHVVDPAGRQTEVAVSVQEKNGRLVEREPSSEDARFCDLGLTPVTVRVAYDSACDQVVVNDVRLYWHQMSFLTVTYDRTLCSERVPMLGCFVLFRVSDNSGRWLDKSSIGFDQPILGPQETDSAGRARIALGPDAIASGTVSSSGFVSQPFAVTCAKDQRVREELIKLEKSAAR
jgi:hypothetical protein